MYSDPQWHEQLADLLEEGVFEDTLEQAKIPPPSYYFPFSSAASSRVRFYFSSSSFSSIEKSDPDVDSGEEIKNTNNRHYIF